MSVRVSSPPSPQPLLHLRIRSLCPHRTNDSVPAHRAFTSLQPDQDNGDATLALAHDMAEGRGGYEADKAKAVAYLKRAARWSTQAKDELAKIGG
jgi:hypothetical protein